MGEGVGLSSCTERYHIAVWGWKLDRGNSIR